MASNPDSRPLPDGWVTQLNTEYNTWFYVNTKAPGGPQSQWTHPADDKPPAHEFSSPSGPPPGQNEKAGYNAEKSEYAQAGQQPPYDQQQFAQQQQFQQPYQQSPPPQQQQQSGKRGFLSKLTGKASGSQQQGFGGGYPGGYGAPPPPGYAQPMGYGQQPMYGGYPQQQGMYGHQQPMMMQGGRRPGGGGMGAGAGLAMGAGAGLLGGMMIGNAMADNEHDAYAEGYEDGAGGDDFGGDF